MPALENSNQSDNARVISYRFERLGDKSNPGFLAIFTMIVTDDATVYFLFLNEVYINSCY